MFLFDVPRPLDAFVLPSHQLILLLIAHSFLSAYVQQSDEDVSQFDTRFTRQTPVDSPDDTSLSHSAELAFAVRLSSSSDFFSVRYIMKPHIVKGSSLVCCF